MLATVNLVFRGEGLGPWMREKIQRCFQDVLEDEAVGAALAPPFVRSVTSVTLEEGGASPAPTMPDIDL